MSKARKVIEAALHGPYRFYNTCVGWDMQDVDALNDMISNRQEISRQAFLRFLTPEDRQTLPGPKDWAVHYYRSTLHGYPVVFHDQSAIEHVWVPDDFSPVSESRKCAHRLGGRCCSWPASVVRGGKHYCTRHDPERSHNSLVSNGRLKARWVAESDDYPYAAEDFLERVGSQRADMVREFDAKKGQGLISWPRIKAEPLTRIWLVYGKRGTVYDEEALDKIKEQTLDLVARLYASTELCGHTAYDNREEAGEERGKPFTDEEWDRFLGMLEDEKGNYLLSDYAFKWLVPFYEKLYAANTPEDKLMAIDRILNVVHQRSDLAGVFVEGGEATLSKIANQGGYVMPDEQHDQKRAMAQRVPSPW